jgi:molecular chaperone GrpE
MEQKDFQQEEKQSSENGLDTEMDINADADISGSAHLNEPVQESPESEELRRELDEMKDKYIRLVAEFDNYKRRTSRERIEMIQTAGKEVIEEMLEVIDDFERALSLMENAEEVGAVKEGVKLIFNKLRNKMEARGLKPMETKGQPFDADKHEAVTEIPAPSEELKGHIVDEIQKGYYLGDKIIRYAKVVVGK